MRYTTWASALLLTLAAATPALASVGLPRLASLDVGPYQATLLGDSPQLHTGTNTITLAVPELPHEAKVALQFVGPKGQVVRVPLKPLVVLSGPEGDHGAKVDDHGSAKVDDHGDGGDDHGNAKVGDHGDGGDDHGGGEVDANASQLRGKAVLKEIGAWKAVLTIDGVSEAFTFDVVQGGPNRLFVGFAGSVMGGAILFGIVERRRKPGREV